VATLTGRVAGVPASDLVAVNKDGTWVMKSSGTTFAAPTQWSSMPFFGTKATLGSDPF
jgi:hypothetical protein